MNIISVKQLREQFPAISRGIRQGKWYLLIYRSKPLAEIHPITNTSVLTEKEDQERIRKDVALVKKLAGGIKTGKDITPEKMNQWIEEQYDEEFKKLFPGQ
ncbi:hypothetical protein HY468_01005 [Candidatus Roizmanbacteria bacterium]|nr:hypothetical protein [Candidatus Roizmanbacteria bacterium]